MTTRQALLHALGLTLAVSPALLRAQAATAASPAVTVAEDETHILAPFVTRTDKDVGYIANDTLSAGRLSTNLLKTPADITVLTRDFLDEVAAINIHDASRWLTNSAVTEPTERDFGTSVTFRGLPSGANTRNYFQYFFTTEQYVIERLEGSRGPNSILYGDSTSGGQTNAITKRARPNASTALHARFDTEGTRYFTLDANRPLTKSFDVRLNALYQNQRTWQENYFDDRYAAALATTYRPWKGAELRFDGELGYRRTANRVNAFTDAASSWDGVTTVSGPLAANPAASSGLTRFTNDRLIYIPSLGGGVLNFRNFAETLGTGLTVVGEDRPFARFPVMPRREFRVAPAQYRLGTHFQTTSLFFEQTWDSGLVVELAANHSVVMREGNSTFMNNAQVDVNRVLPDGRANPNFGKWYSEAAYPPLNNATDYTGALRAAAAYAFGNERFNQVVSVVANYRDHVFDNYLTSYGNSTNPAQPSPRNAANTLRVRVYWDQPFDGDIGTPPDPAYNFVQSVGTDSRNEQRLQSIQANTVGNYFTGRVTLLAGARYDKFAGKVMDTDLFNAVGDPIRRNVTLSNRNVTSTSVGAVYFPIKSAGVYANYSEGFLPSTPSFPSLILGGRGVNLAKANVMGFGARFNLLDRRLVGSIGYYQSEEQNRPQTVATAQINQIWEDMGLSDRRVLGGTFASYIDTFNSTGRGWEADITMNFDRSFRLKFNFALPHTEQSDSIPDSNAYYAANIAAWRAAAADASNPNRARIATNIAAYENVLANAVDGRSINGTYDYRANIFGTYLFPQSVLKGLRVGGGANVYGQRLLGSPTNSPLSYIYAKSYWTAMFTLGYNFKFRRLPVDLQLNVSNVLDYDDPVYTAVSVFGGNVYRNAYYYEEPRKATLSTTVRF